MVYAQAMEGVPFDSLARNYSVSETAERSGYVGYIEKGLSDKPYEKQAFKTKEGSVSKPVQTDEGYWIVKVLDKKKANQRELDQVSGMIRQKLFEEKRSNAEDELRERLLASAEVEIIPEPENAFGEEEPEEPAEPEGTLEPVEPEGQ
jgi:parvulin-like peptidyl-prolyl isomerase